MILFVRVSFVCLAAYSYSEGCIYTQFCIYWHALVLEGVWVGDGGDEGMDNYIYIYI